MQKHRQRKDYQPVRRSERASAPEDERLIAEDWPAEVHVVSDGPGTRQGLESSDLRKTATTFLKRGHVFSYAALFVFTIIMYARPGEMYPSPLTASIALMFGVLTLICFIPSQLSLEGSFTARPREVNLVLLFAATGLLSIPLAISPYEAWHEFSNTFVRCVVIFIVMVNVVRTELRLKGLLSLALATGIWLSLGAINDYRLGLSTVEGYRVAGRGGGIFGNPNDMALYLVSIVPVAIALLLGSRGLARKLLFGGCAVLMIAGIVLTYSRGGFIGLLVALCFFAWKVGRKRRVGVLVVGFVMVAIFLVLVPSYALRLASILLCT